MLVDFDHWRKWYFERTTGDGFVHWRKSYYGLWTIFLGLYLSRSDGLMLKNTIMMDLFITVTQLFTSQDIKWWTGVVLITCVLLWCFYQLFGLLFRRHPFTAEDPVSKWCNATFHQILMKKQTYLYLEWPEGKCPLLITFGWTIHLNRTVMNSGYRTSDKHIWFSL